MLCFVGCNQLEKLPKTFTIPANVRWCDNMFNECINLEKLPDNFTLPDNVEDCKYMFARCYRLKQLPKDFSIPNTSDYDDIFLYTKLEDKYDVEDLLR